MLFCFEQNKYTSSLRLLRKDCENSSKPSFLLLNNTDRQNSTPIVDLNSTIPAHVSQRRPTISCRKLFIFLVCRLQNQKNATTVKCSASLGRSLLHHCAEPRKALVPESSLLSFAASIVRRLHSAAAASAAVQCQCQC
ncbi:uncharacterized protein LOC127566289 [Drosophila albomicans]|uniref:Uncharacterized protein LOC127566289 n=1 Tax=Drosophila albomicans TaxID=7291 RepID=A0A9C6WEC1_DROAB|nr:uncharacterized protein LOC127566289 [Drosophila albomicans]